MLVCIILIVISVISSAFSQPMLSPEANFLGISNLDSLSNNWKIEITDSVENEFIEPMDIEVLRLSPADYRFVLLDSGRKLFTQFKLDQESGISVGEVICSGSAPDSCYLGSAMCQVRQGDYFDPESDRVAVAFKLGAQIGIYRFNKWTEKFTLERSFSNALITAPIGIFWAFDNFFIVDEALQTIFRTDSLGNRISQYGHEGLFDDGYGWISDISGFVDEANIVHMYVGDGVAERVDHLTASAADTSIYLFAQAVAQWHDTLGMITNEVSRIPGAGICGFSTPQQRILLWSDEDSLRSNSRDEIFWADEFHPAMRAREACGRLVVFSLALGAGEMGWDIRSFIPQGALLDNPVVYPQSHWTLADSPVIITDSLQVGPAANSTLTIDAGVQVLFDQGAALVVNSGAELIVNGTSLNPVEMKNWNSEETWGGIYVNGGELLMSHTNISATYFNAISTNSPAGSSTPILIEDCTIDGGKMTIGASALRLIGNPSVKQVVNRTMIDNVVNGYGLYAWNCFVTMDGLEVRNCSYSNSYLKLVTGNFRNCIFKGRPSNHGVMFSGPGTTPNFQCCTFENVCANSGFNASLYAIPGTAPTFGYEGSSGGVSNTISDSCDNLLKMNGSGVKPIIDNVLSGGGAGGRNDWYQAKAAGKFITWSSAPPVPAGQYSALKQYWNHAGATTPTITDFVPSTTGYFDFNDYMPAPYDLCGGEGAIIEPGPGQRVANLDDEPSEHDSIFAVALGMEVEELFSGAQELYHDIAAEAFSSSLRWQAMSHIVSTQRHLDGISGNQWIPGLFDVLQAADSFSYESHVFGERLLSSYRVDRSEYEESIVILTTLLSSGLTAGDSLLVADDIVGVQLMMGIEAGAGLDESALDLIPVSLRIQSEEHGRALDRELLRRWAFDSAGELEREVTLPSTFRLYQNYPNPFNPTTEIQFDLPENSQVKLRIYNTLGQLAATLIDETRQAGRHTVTWDASALSSGLYVYRLEANGFVDAKKMVLIR